MDGQRKQMKELKPGKTDFQDQEITWKYHLSQQLGERAFNEGPTGEYTGREVDFVKKFIL